jgi:hypothetical protein
MIPTELRLKFAPQCGQESAVEAIIPPHALQDVIRLMILPTAKQSVSGRR